MKIEALDIPAVKLITPKKYIDTRGFFIETFRQTIFNDILNQEINFIQDNHSLSYKAGTIRGLHFQAPPHGQGLSLIHI